MQEITVVRAPGWHTLADQDDRFFVCPSGQIVGGPDGNPLELSAGARIAAPVAKGGTLEGWKAAVAAAVAVPGCQHWALGAMAGFAASARSPSTGRGLISIRTCSPRPSFS